MFKKLYPYRWPKLEATEDLNRSMLLYQYARYGLEIRQLLEIDGPYTLDVEHIPYLEHLTISDVFRLPSEGPDYEKRRSKYEEQKAHLLQTARGQFLLYAYSIFDLFIANVIIDLYMIGGNAPGVPDRPDNDELIWDESERIRFMDDKRISEIEESKWMIANGFAKHRTQRIDLLEEHGFVIRGFDLTNERGNILDWSFFSENRKSRHIEAHAAGRSIIHDNPKRELQPLTDDTIFDLAKYLGGQINSINQSVYDLRFLWWRGTDKD